MRVRGHRRNADVIRNLNNRKRRKNDTDHQARCLCGDQQSVVVDRLRHEVGQVCQRVDADKAIGGQVMKTHYAVALAMLAGIGIGAAAVQTLHAQVKPAALLHH